MKRSSTTLLRLGLFVVPVLVGCADDSPAAGGGAGGGGSPSSGGSSSGGSSSGGNDTGGSSSGGSSSGGSSSGGSSSGGSSSGGSGPGGNGSGGDPTGGAGGAGGGMTGCMSDMECDNGLFCDGSESCVLGACVPGSDPCDDGVSCTADTCDEGTVTCTHVASDAPCDDGVQCNGMEFCDPLLDCQAGTAPSCDDGVACTADFCDLLTDACVSVTQDAACGDGLLCNGVETCDGTLGCLAGTPVVCNDGIGCTNDACSEAALGCVFSPSNAACNDGNFCNGAETCSPTQGCVAGAAPNCDDGVACTTDSCSMGLNACQHTTNDAFCDDGMFCNGTETCSATQGCVTTGAVQCPSDGIQCTVDACNENLDTCQSTPNGNLCLPGQFCIVGTGCSDAPPCSTAADCGDGDACNGIETCNGATPGVPNSGVCAPGAPVDCDDFLGCTVDTCDPQTGQCTNAPDHPACSDGLGCNGQEVCDTLLGCINGSPIVCNDGIACTQDQCAEPGVCAVSSFDHDQCQDGNPCDSTEQCTATGCMEGAPTVCADDGIACTVESCDSVLGCVSTPDDALCPCGETCDPAQGGCGNFCVVSECQGKVYACGDCLDNDGDCLIDSDDDECLGSCDNTEDSLYGGIPGQNNSPCKSDCYFDQDTGSGNDDCYWSHKCDPLSVAPNYPPEGSQCAYNPNANIPGYAGSCSDAFMTQSATCGDYCGPLTPNGCDCFGCCAIPGAPTTVWLGSVVNNQGSCTLADVGDPALCKPCTQVQACLNTCEQCEICIGKPDLPPGCVEQSCDGAQPCGQPGQGDCPVGTFCVTGCCQDVAE